MTLLSQRERRTLETLCDTLMPAMQPGPGDDPALFSLSAGSIGVLPDVEEAIGTLEGRLQVLLKMLLGLLEQPAWMLALVGKAQPFTRLSEWDRESALRALARSPLPLLRMGFQGIKRLTGFLFFALPEPSGTNPTWGLIGYNPAANRPARTATLRLSPATGATALECDVCVIGSGAGGSVVAAEAAAAGKRVIVLEAGPGQQAPDYDQQEYVGTRRLYLDQGLTATRDLGITILAGATLGGGTAVNWQTSLALPPEVRDEWAHLSGCDHFTSSEFDASFEAVMNRIGASTEESRINPNNDSIRRGCEALGYSWKVIARNARGCDLDQCGSCVFGCRHGGKQSTAVTYLHDARATGDAVIIPECRAERVIITQGRVAGVQARTAGGSPVSVRARTVVVAAGALHSPALLMRSGVSLPELGRNLYLHPTTAVTAFFSEPVEMWNGPPQTVMSDHFANSVGPYGFRFETAPGHPGLIGLAAPWFGARDYRSKMQLMAHVAAMIVLTRDKTGGRVKVGRDGRPLAEYRLGRQERELMQKGVAEAARIQVAAGATRVQGLNSLRHEIAGDAIRSPEAVEAFCRRLEQSRLDANWSTVFSAHQMGTCRMGANPRTAVIDPDGQVFGVRGLYVADGSAFPASSGVNPMVTIMALAHFIAQRVVSNE